MRRAAALFLVNSMHIVRRTRWIRRGAALQLNESFADGLSGEEGRWAGKVIVFRAQGSFDSFHRGDVGSLGMERLLQLSLVKPG